MLSPVWDIDLIYRWAGKLCFNLSFDSIHLIQSVCICHRSVRRNAKPRLGHRSSISLGGQVLFQFGIRLIIHLIQFVCIWYSAPVRNAKPRLRHRSSISVGGQHVKTCDAPFATSILYIGGRANVASVLLSDIDFVTCGV